MQNGVLTLVRGDDVDVGVTVQNTDGTPYILSGASLTFSARSNSFYDSTVVLTKVVTGHLAPESGLSAFTFTSGDTLNINDQKHYFDIKLFSSANKTSTLMNGALYVVPANYSCSS